MSEKIEWITTKVSIGQLKEYKHNPRRISTKDFDRLVNDIKRDGYHNRLLVDNDLTIIGGHSRRAALLKAGLLESTEIEVLKCSRPLSEEEFKRINIKDNLPFGEFDYNILADHFHAPDLVEWGMPIEWLTGDLIEPKKEEPPKDNELAEICDKCGRIV